MSKFSGVRWLKSDARGTMFDQSMIQAPACLYKSFFILRDIEGGLGQL